jgi:hypothetical protein
MNGLRPLSEPRSGLRRTDALVTRSLRGIQLEGICSTDADRRSSVGAATDGCERRQQAGCRVPAMPWIPRINRKPAHCPESPAVLLREPLDEWAAPTFGTAFRFEAHRCLGHALAPRNPTGGHLLDGQSLLVIAATCS